VSTIELRDEVSASDDVSPLPFVVGWRWETRVAFRWCVLYFGVCFILLGSTGTLSLHLIPAVDSLPPLKSLIEWTAAHVFGASLPLSTNGGSGDKTGDWVETAIFLTIATIGTITWTWLDRARPRYDRLQTWFRWLLRYILGTEMLYYGLSKVIPVQMPAPGLARLLTPYGTFSPMGALWSFMGSSRAYEIFAGSMEVAGGILLLIPGFTTLGALVTLAAMTNVFVLNMTYDVCVKLFSFHLLLMSLVLLAPDVNRLATVIVLRRAVPAAPEPPLVQSRRIMRILIAAQVLVALYLIGTNIHYQIGIWNKYGAGFPRSPLYGIWRVDTMTIDGQPRPPLTTDPDRWRRVIFDRNDTTTVQLMDDTLHSYLATLDLSAKTLTLTKRTDQSWTAHLALQRVAPDRVTIDGPMDGHVLHTELHPEDLSRFLLRTRGFNWIQEQPFSR
jgi:uncharacterized membrane protein YphA (DoxX/SURF4 family)